MKEFKNGQKVYVLESTKWNPAIYIGLDDHVHVVKILRDTWNYKRVFDVGIEVTDDD